MKIKRYAIAAALGLFILVSPRTVRADSTTFDASGKFGDGSALVGTVMIDTLAGSVTAVDLSVGPPGFEGPLTTFDQRIVTGQIAIEVIGTGGTGAEIFLQLPVGSLIGYAGSNLCNTTTVACPFAASSFYAKGSVIVNLSSGALTEVTGVSAPEPSSLALIPLGLVAALLMRKRVGHVRPAAI